MTAKPKEPEVLDSTSINAKVDFSLTKDDLTEMVLEERFEALEDELDKTNKLREELVKRMDVIKKKHNERLMALVKKEFAKRIVAVKRFTGSEILCSIQNCRQYAVSSTDHFTFQNFERTYDSKRRRKIEKSARTDGWTVPKSVSLQAASKTKQKECEEAKTSSENILWDLTRTFTDDEMVAMPLVQDLVALDSERKELSKQTVLLEAELSNLDTAGKRARAKMVKALLSASEQGRALLDKMPRMNPKLLTAQKEKNMKELLIVCAPTLCLVAAIVFGPNVYEHFGKRYANADREIHQKSKSFVQGAVEHIQRLKLDYDKTDNKQHKQAIKQLVLVQAATVELHQFPPHLQSWIEQLRRQ